MPRDYTPDGQIGKLVVRGRTLSPDLARAVLSGTVSTSRSEVTQLDLILSDPDEQLLTSRLFELGGQADYGDLLLAVAALETTTVDGVSAINVTARSWRAQRMRKARGKLVERNTSPTEYMRRRAAAAGYKFLGEPSAKRNTVARATGDQPESDWQTGQRLANELGYVAFESGNTYIFGRPTWILKRAAAFKVSTGTPGLLGRPKCRRTSDDPAKFATVGLETTTALAARALPGMRLELTGVPTFAGYYLIDSVTVPLADDGVATIAASTPTNPEAQGEQDTTATTDPNAALAALGVPGAATEERSLGGGTALAFTDLALKQAGKPYVFGSQNNLNDADPAAFDCSELVRWCAGRLGVEIPDGSAKQRAWCISKGADMSVADAIKTRGALLFSPGHVAISLGNGQTIEAMNREYGVRKGNARRYWDMGGRVPGLKYQRRQGPAGNAYVDPV